MGPTRVRSGTISFEDRTFDEPFRTRIDQLAGTSAITVNDPGSTTGIEFRARVTGKAPLNARATVSPTEIEETMDLDLELRELSLPPFSPYTSRFVGHRIDGGKLELTLDYRVRNGLLQGTNKLRLDHLIFGKKVNEKPIFSVPLKLGVALLQTKKKMINLSIPVEGNLRDPAFQLQGTINRAIRSALGTVFSSPLDFLAGLVGAKAEDLRSIDFEPAEHELLPKASTNVDKLAEALRVRPKIRLQIRPVWSEADRTFLSRKRLQQAIDQEGGTLNNPVDSRRALEDVYERQFSNARRRKLLERHTNRPEGSFSETLNKETYAAELRDQLLDANEPDEAELNSLAAKRAETVRSALSERGIPAERLYVLDRRKLESTETPVPLPLELSSE